MDDRIKNQTFSDGDKVWKIPRLLMLASELEPFDLPLKHLNVYRLYPDINSTADFVNHIRYTLDADLDCPIILDDEGYVMDGRHRIARALLEKRESIKAVRFDETPPPCYLTEKK